MQKNQSVQTVIRLATYVLLKKKPKKDEIPHQNTDETKYKFAYVPNLCPFIHI